MNNGDRATLEESVGELMQSAAQNSRMNKHRFFLGYLRGTVKSAPLYGHWQSFLTYLRRFRMLTLILRAVGLFLTILETGALVLLTTALFLVILPILSALMLGILVTAGVESRHSNTALKKSLKDRQMIVWFLRTDGGSFQWENARDLTRRGYVVLLISPHWISPRGMRRLPFYCTFRQECTDVYLIRRYYFFSLRKHVLTRRNVIYVY